ncbi:MAG: hypothetical protein OES38_06545, partial [Gammaproteobacteria bacterium]|nr:hypothetical protein [Gammaproteobacteria bacterium]
IDGSLFRAWGCCLRPALPSVPEEFRDGYVIVRNRDHWFYIDDRDVASKRTFAMLQLILSLTDAGEGARGPVVSISN